MKYQMEVLVRLWLMMLVVSGSLSGCGLLYGECISGSVVGVAVDQDGAPIEGAEILACDLLDPSDCSDPEVLGVSDADGAFDLETDLDKRGGRCRAADVVVRAEGCTSVQRTFDDLQDEPTFVLDCS